MNDSVTHIIYIEKYCGYKQYEPSSSCTQLASVVFWLELILITFNVVTSIVLGSEITSIIWRQSSENYNLTVFWAILSKTENNERILYI